MSKRKNSAKSSASELLAEILAINLDESAHFKKTGAHAFANPVAERVFTASSSRSILKISCDNSCPVFVVTGIQYQTHCIPHPLRWFDRTQIIEYDNITLEKRP